MTAQLVLALDDPKQGASRKRDCSSSKAAAKKVNAERQRDLLLRYLRLASDGLTADELASCTGLERYVIASRLSQMSKWGDAESFGTRLNHNNIAVKVWHATRARVVDVVVAGSRL